MLSIWRLQARKRAWLCRARCGFAWRTGRAASQQLAETAQGAGIQPCNTGGETRQGEKIRQNDQSTSCGQQEPQTLNCGDRSPLLPSLEAHFGRGQCVRFPVRLQAALAVQRIRKPPGTFACATWMPVPGREPNSALADIPRKRILLPPGNGLWHREGAEGGFRPISKRFTEPATQNGTWHRRASDLHSRPKAGISELNAQHPLSVE
jgi:hypothetical protein